MGYIGKVWYRAFQEGERVRKDQRRGIQKENEEIIGQTIRGKKEKKITRTPRGKII